MELLVVIGIIALLVALLLPAINKAKSIGQRVTCINNEKQLQMAHTVFSDDHGDKILYSSAWKYEKCASYAWMAGSLNLSSYANRERWLASSPLFPYVGKSAGVFKCPADKDVVRIMDKKKTYVKELIPRHRSYSINIHVGGWSGWPVQKDRMWRIYHKQQDIEVPSNIFTFMKSIPAYWQPYMKIIKEIWYDEDIPEEKVIMEEVSPVFHIDKIKKPLFVVQGANDPRVNINEADQIVEGLRKKGIDVPYMVKYDEGHGFAKEENRIEFYQTMMGFFAKHLR